MQYKHLMEFRLVLKRNESLTRATTRMALEDVTISEIRKTQKDKYTDSIYARHLAEPIRRARRWHGGHGRGGAAGWEGGMDG